MNDLHVISLGAGVQSTTMALMAAAGEIEPMPSCGVAYLHSSLLPLTAAPFAPDDRQPNLFGNECEGMCGV